MAPVDEDRELHGPGPAELDERVERGADRAAGEEHVVDEHDDPAADVDGDLGRAERLDRPQADVVAVEGDVERPDRHGHPLEALDGGGEPAGDRTSERSPGHGPLDRSDDGGERSRSIR